jgi:hypothetical protein
VAPSDATQVLLKAMERETDGNLKLQFATVLATAAGKMQPTDRIDGRVTAEVRHQAFEVIVGTLTKGPDAIRYFVRETLVPFAEKVPPSDAAQVLLKAMELETDGNLKLQFAMVLAAAAGKMQPTDRIGGRGAIEVCHQAFEVIVATLTEGPVPTQDEPALVLLMEKMHASDAAQGLLKALERETDAYRRFQWATALAEAAGKLEPLSAARILASATAIETDAGVPAPLISKLATIAERLKPSDAEEICTPVARRIASALDKVVLTDEMDSAALNLTTISARIKPVEAEKICGAAVRVLSASLRDVRNREARKPIVRGLASLSVRIDQDEAVKTARLVAATDWDHADWELHTLFTTTMAPADAPKAARVLRAASVQETDPHARWLFAAGLFLVSQRLRPAEAAHHCAPILPALIAAFNRSNEGCYSYMTDGLVAITSCLDPVQAREAVQSFGAALERSNREKDLGNLRLTLVCGLAAAGARSAPEATATLISREMERERGNISTQLQLASSLLSLAEKMNQPVAKKTLEQATESLITMAKRGDEQSVGIWLRTVIILASFADKMTNEDAARLCSRAVRAIAIARRIEEALHIAERTAEVPHLSIALGLLASRMEPAEASSVCRVVIRSVLKESRYSLEEIIPLFAQLEPEIARSLATEWALWTCAQNDINVQVLDRILTEVGRAVPVAQAIHRLGIIEEGIIKKSNDQQPPKKPLPCRLTTQTLIELLKMPTCFGEARRVVLDHLGNRYGRRFFNHWEFVRYAREQGLKLDFTTPPRRPDTEETVKRMLEILDDPNSVQ